MKFSNIAILGNGQLAMMLSESAQKLAVKTTSFSLPKIDKLGLANEDEINHWRTELKDFDALTYEIENIPVNLLKQLEVQLPVMPAIAALETAQDRLKEKELATKLHLPTNRYAAVSSLELLYEASEKLGFPLVLKTRRFGYDGKGQSIIKNKNEIETAWNNLKEAEYLIAEAFVDFDYEVSQIASRDQSGAIVFYPLTQNIHRDGILRESFVLSDKKELSLKAQKIASQLLEHFQYVGTLAIEFFVKDQSLFINEMAPRVHNSGHWSIQGATVSQFENHLRAVSGLNIIEPKVTAPYVMMINLIGEDVPEGLADISGVYPYSYGKTLRANRKMGHINIISQTKEAHIERIKQVYSKLQVSLTNPCGYFY